MWVLDILLMGSDILWRASDAVHVPTEQMLSGTVSVWFHLAYIQSLNVLSGDRPSSSNCTEQNRQNAIQYEQSIQEQAAPFASQGAASRPNNSYSWSKSIFRTGTAVVPSGMAAIHSWYHKRHEAYSQGCDTLRFAQGMPPILCIWISLNPASAEWKPA